MIDFTKVHNGVIDVPTEKVDYVSLAQLFGLACFK